MTLVAAAVCPHPPVLVPAIAAGAAAELDDVRAACRSAIEVLLGTGAPLHVVGADTGERADGFGPWGVDLAVEVPEPSPLPHLVAAWLLRSVGAAATRWHLVPPDAPRDRCLEIGRDLAGGKDVALLVMGDGSARHSERAPGWLDPRAGGYDDEVARALRVADPAALAELDPALSCELLAVGRAPWQVLAGAAGDAGYCAEGAHFWAPYGVGYHVVTWRRAGICASKPNGIR